MLIWLAGLESWFGPFRLFGYTSFRCAGAMATTFLLMLFLMPGLIAWLRRKKFGEQGSKNEGAAMAVEAARDAKKGTPTMGGLGLIAALAWTGLLWCNPTQAQTGLLLAALLGFGLLGFVDDRAKIFKGAHGISGRYKLLLQLGLAALLGLAVWWCDHALIIGRLVPAQDHDGTWSWRIAQVAEVARGQLALPFLGLKHLLPIGLGLIAWTVVVLFLCSNSVNFTDGLDGLASGVMIVAALAFMVIAFLTGNFVTAHYLKILFVPGAAEVAVFCAGAVGACLGFLWFNAPPAQVFMGDTGSQALGAVLAMASLLTKQEILVVLVGFVFFIEGGSVLLQILWFKGTGGRRLFRCAPIHHHFQILGWPETRIVLRFWIVAVFAALLALATLKLR